MIYLHLGVHKTATTYLQDLLAANQGKMALNGRAYWKLLQTRSILEDLQVRWYWSEEGREHLRTHPASPLLRLRSLTRTGTDCVLSDENVLGSTTDTIEGRLYPRAIRRLHRLKTALQDEEVEIWVSLRTYDEFLASSYCESLRHGYFAPIEEFTQRNGALWDQRWPALAETIHECFPDSRLVIWRYEDFRSLLPEIAGRLAGIPYPALHHLSADVRASPSAKAIEMHSADAAAMKPAERILSMAKCDELYPLKAFPAKFYPWSPGVADAMQAAYRDDMEDIRRRKYVEFLSTS